MDVWYIDLEKRVPVISKYERKYLEMDLWDIKSADPIDLDDYDWRIFLSQDDADEFLWRYMQTKSKLEAGKIETNKTFGLHVPHMLYKRRYIVQTLMGLKNQTVRKYFRDWEVGQLVNLHDQKHFLTVRIMNLSKAEAEV